MLYYVYICFPHHQSNPRHVADAQGVLLALAAIVFVDAAEGVKDSLLTSRTEDLSRIAATHAAIFELETPQTFSRSSPQHQNT